MKIGAHAYRIEAAQACFAERFGELAP